jgi:heterodisulfide reductase subunit C
MAKAMDLMPNQVMRLVQMGELDRASASDAVWLCVACQACTARCPKSVDPAGVMDALRQRSVQRNAASSAARRTISFQKAFLDNIRRNGRVNEMELVGQFKMMAFAGDFSLPLLFKDAFLGPRMMARHKLHLRSQKVRDRALVRRIFQRCAGE